MSKAASENQVERSRELRRRPSRETRRNLDNVDIPKSSLCDRRATIARAAKANRRVAPGNEIGRNGPRLMIDAATTRGSERSRDSGGVRRELDWVCRRSHAGARTGRSEAVAIWAQGNCRRELQWLFVVFWCRGLGNGDAWADVPRSQLFLRG